MTSDSTSPVPVQTIELLRRARSGDDAAVEELFARYTPRVRGLVALRMGRSLVDLADQDDVVQEALLTALAGIDSFEPRTEGSFVCWLASIVQSRIENARRAARAEKRGGGSVRRGSELGSSTVAHLPAAGGPSPSEVASAREADAALEGALLTLPSAARQIVYCRLVLDMSHGEITEALGLDNVDSVRARFHKAVARLRRQLDAAPRGD